MKIERKKELISKIECLDESIDAVKKSIRQVDKQIIRTKVWGCNLEDIEAKESDQEIDNLTLYHDLEWLLCLLWREERHFKVSDLIGYLNDRTNAPEGCTLRRFDNINFSSYIGRYMKLDKRFSLEKMNSNNELYYSFNHFIIS